MLVFQVFYLMNLTLSQTIPAKQRKIISSDMKHKWLYCCDCDTDIETIKDIINDYDMYFN